MQGSAQRLVEAPSPFNVVQNTNKSSSFWKVGFFITLIILVGVGLGLGYLYLTKYPTVKTPAEMSAPEVVVPTTYTTPKGFMGSYTFDYPMGWHVVNQWPGETKDGITIYLNPDPINFAPRGGPISSLRITDTSGVENPDELFEAAKEAYKAELTDLQEEVLESGSGSVYHYSGKVDFYNEMVNTEGYFFQIQGGVDDAINKHNMFATSDVNGNVDGVLKQVVMSFKKAE